jgi:hypothetical protein
MKGDSMFNKIVAAIKAAIIVTKEYLIPPKPPIPPKGSG